MDRFVLVLAAHCFAGQISFKELLRALLTASRFLECPERARLACGSSICALRWLGSHRAAVEPSAFNRGHKPMIAFLPDLPAMRALHGFDLMRIAHASSSSLSQPTVGRAARTRQGTPLRGLSTCAVGQHEESGHSTSPRTSNVADHCKHHVTVPRVWLAFMNLHTSATPSKAAALFAVKKTCGLGLACAVSALGAMSKAAIRLFFERRNPSTGCCPRLGGWERDY